MSSEAESSTSWLQCVAELHSETHCHCLLPQKASLAQSGIGPGCMLCTAGTAVIDGLDIRSDMADIYATMGVCPQHDLLWETLTGREHLLFYGRLKNLKVKAVMGCSYFGPTCLWLSGFSCASA